jgi:hypothetical protein
MKKLIIKLNRVIGKDMYIKERKLAMPSQEELK